MLTVLIVLQFIVAALLIIIVLLQQSKGEGLGSIGGGGQIFFDKSKGTEKALQKVTTICAVAFMVLSLLIAVLW